MDYQEKIMYMGLITIIEILVLMTPDDEYKEIFNEKIQRDILEINMLIDQRIKETKENELGW